MRLNTSLSTKITLVFIFTFALLVFAFLSFHKIIQQNSHEDVIKQYEQIARYFERNRAPHYEVQSYLEQLDFKLIENPHSLLKHHHKPLIRKRGFEVFIIDNSYYLHILTPHFRVLALDTTNTIEKQYLHFIVFGIVTLLFIAIYLLILKNIRDTNLLLNSRQLFLRTVMHELKTPIAKGKIVSELLDDEKQKTRMSQIFDKLNFLINDFAKVEQVVSKNFTINLQTYTINEILEYSFEMSMVDKLEDIIIQKTQEDKTLQADIDLLAMAFKNLIDNGLKYSKDHTITIEVKGNELLFISTGRKLPKPLNDYFKPFHNDTTSKNHGMGLGLYIVHSILEIHNFRLEYSYTNSQNIFTIIFR